tara:strand:- start:257 stop:703 length:447 start_codon:yes stop_codon:yes gene_type:complete
MLAERLNGMFADIAPDAPPFTEADVDRLHRLFPAVNLEVQVETIAAWLPTARRSRLPKKSPYKFLLNWLGKADRQQRATDRTKDREDGKFQQAVVANRAAARTHERTKPASPEALADAREKLAQIFGLPTRSADAGTRIRPRRRHTGP